MEQEKLKLEPAAFPGSCKAQHSVATMRVSWQRVRATFRRVRRPDVAPSLQLVLWSGLAAMFVLSAPARANRAAAIYESGHAASLQVERIGPEHGLAHNTVRAILEDREGFLWLGTEDGLQRYDGVDFETFRAGTSTLALSHSRVERLMETADGSLWIGTTRGLDVLSPDRRALRRLRLEYGDGPYAVTSLAVSPDGEVSVGTIDHGLLVTTRTPQGGHVLQYEIDDL